MTPLLMSLGAHRDAYPYLLPSTRQRLAVNPDGTPLDADGRLGPRSQAALYADLMQLLNAHPLVAALTIHALAGAGEEGGGNKGQWPGVALARSADPRIGRRVRHPDWDPHAPRDRDAALAYSGGAWCAGEMSLAITQVYGNRVDLTSWGATDLLQRWLRAGAGVEVSAADARAGDLIAWRDVDGSGGHVGCVAGCDRDLLLTLEGNGSRRWGQVGLYGYSAAQGYTRGRQELVRLVRPTL
jgi:hypothetical protein